MLDTNSFEISNGGNSYSVSISSVSGILAKSTAESKIVRFHMTSRLAKTFFNLRDPHYMYSEADGYLERKQKVSVLQVMLCGNDEFLVEYLDVE